MQFSETMPLLSPAKARCFAGSGVPPARVGPWQLNRCCPCAGVASRL